MELETLRTEIKLASRVQKLKLFVPDVYDLINKLSLSCYGLTIDELEKLQNFSFEDEDIYFETIYSNKFFKVGIYNSSLPSNNVNRNLLIKNYGIFKPFVSVEVEGENHLKNEYKFYVSETNCKHPYVYCKSSNGKKGITRYDYLDNEIGVFPVSVNSVDDIEEIVK